jgi:oxygen-independent coproporphyrinogen-3 oxidase
MSRVPTASPNTAHAAGTARTTASAGPTRYRELTRDGVELSLVRFAGDVRRDTPVLLTHGTFSNAQVCGKLAGFLADHGFDCFVLELRGHGQSGTGPGTPDFQRMADFDVPAALEAVRRRTGKPQAFLVAHSGGGLVFLMHLARTLESCRNVKGLVTLASQATEAGASLRARAKIAGFAALNNVLGYFPGASLGLGPEDEHRGVMNQWFRWNWSGRWLARDGFDYEEALGHVDVPALCLAGAGDRFIAPVQGCRRLYDRLGSRDKRLVVCGRATGFAEDYGHARLIASRGAWQEIWPLILLWLLERT